MENLLWALIQSESTSILIAVLTAFKKYCDINNITVPKFKFIITDMALSFFNALTQVFPSQKTDMKLLYCQWHFYNKIRENFQSFLSQKHRAIYLAIIKKIYTLVHSTTLELIEENRNIFFSLLDDMAVSGEGYSKGVLKIKEYIIRNYSSCEDRWLIYYRLEAVVNVNMSMERYFGIIKNKQQNKGRTWDLCRLITIICERASENLKRVAGSAIFNNLESYRQRESKNECKTVWRSKRKRNVYFNIEKSIWREQGDLCMK